MKSLRQYLLDADRKASRKALKEISELLDQRKQKMAADGEWRMKTLKRRKWN